MDKIGNLNNLPQCMLLNENSSQKTQSNLMSHSPRTGAVWRDSVRNLEEQPISMRVDTNEVNFEGGGDSKEQQLSETNNQDLKSRRDSYRKSPKKSQ